MVHIRTGIIGGVHLKAVFDESLDDFKKKVLNLHPNKAQKILGCKGYKDQTTDILIRPYNGKIFGFDDSKLKHIKNLGNLRVIVENFFSRLKSTYMSIHKQDCSLVSFIISQLFKVNNILYKPNCPFFEIISCYVAIFTFPDVELPPCY